MTAPDLEEPRMIWTGPLPPHLQRAEGPAEDPWFEVDQAAPRIPPLAVTAAVAGVALVAGIAIGALVPPLVRSGLESAAKAAPAVAAPVEAAAARPAPVAETPAPVAAAEAPVAELQPAAAAPRIALAMLTAPAKGPSVRVSTVAAARPVLSRCDAGSQADRAVCANSQVAAADHDLKQAYQRAVASGASAVALHEDQIDWLLAREEAARRSPADLALAYRQRIDQLNSLADEPPH